MRPGRILVVWLLVLVSGTAELAAQPATLVTDRPDITESSRVVGWGRVQVETSVRWQTFELGSMEEDLLDTPTLIRVGLHRALEFRFGSLAYSTADVSTGGSGDKVSGYAPFVLGGKVHLYESNAGTQSLGLIAAVEIPSGSVEFKTEDTAALVVAAFDSDLGDRAGVGVNAGFTVSEGEAGESLLGGVLTAALGYGFSERLSGFVEFATLGIGLAGDRQQPVIDTGATYLLSPDFQLDAALGSGLNDETGPDFFFTFGASFRAAFLD